MKFRHHPERHWEHLLSIPFIYSVIFPMILLDIFLEIYHRVCFPLYGIPLVNRWQYIRIDRHKLSYLSGIEKLNCAYCGYGNGLFRYAGAIAGETERYWCGIKHATAEGYKEPPHQKDFLPYGDERAYREFVEERGRGVERKDALHEEQSAV